MSIAVSNYPAEVWDGTTPNRSSRDQDKRPDHRDWDQLAAEVIALQQGTPSDGSGAGAAAGTGVSAVTGAAPVMRTVITIEDLEIATTDATTAGAHGTQKIFDFPAGNIAILGASCDLEYATAGPGIDADAAMVTSVGSAAVGVDNATLTSLEANIIPSMTSTLTDSAGVGNGQSTAVAILDGTSSAAAAHLNVAVPDGDNTDTEGDVVTVNGTVTITWVNLGDN